MNYRDLQNISNLSQQILVEGANEEHNVLNRWPYTSPYLQENDSQVYQLDEISPEVVLAASKAADKKGKPAQASRLYKKFAARDQAANYAAYQRSSVNKEQVDIYDIILSHLLDEGYAETLEQAQVIMVNMSEEWRESIIEAVDDTHSGHPNYKGPSQDPLSRANRAIGNAVNFATGQQAAEVRAKQKGVPGNVVVKQSGPFSTKNVPTKGSFISDTEMKRRGQSTKPMGPIGQ